MEKRLIDASKIIYHKSGFPKGDGSDGRLDWAFREDIDNLPTVDAVEVVRCENCQYFGLYNHGKYGFCTHPNGLTNPEPDHFCFYNKGRNETEETEQ